ncbi:hypothetical protein SKA34_08918 [Photobacterium sp. SKA34]|uniref:hypothetical protein n=1 Tax=Photobacterium sp. SKA34 TaxID=121723 RepID=UPI00006B4169|nr:hypothetical protein [Photobacterium sp. SKA34]EAR57696.1 hypothetical protein SKA34_08918 [Photobacterium sp. SKA34]
MKLKYLSILAITSVATSLLLTTGVQAQGENQLEKIHSSIQFKKSEPIVSSKVYEPSLTVEFKDNAYPETNQYLTKLFKAFLASDQSELKTMLTTDFTQKFGGEENRGNAFIQHASTLSKQLKSMDIVFEDVNIDSDGTISEIHTVTATKLNGKSAILKLYAFYYFDNTGKLKKIDELSTLLHGAKADRDLGSRTS